MTTVEKPRAVNDRSTTSRAKNTPARGALKTAATPAAAPAATNVLLRRSDIRNALAIVDPIADPICTIGPSRPADPPEPIVNADAIALT